MSSSLYLSPSESHSSSYSSSNDETSVLNLLSKCLASQSQLSNPTPADTELNSSSQYNSDDTNTCTFNQSLKFNNYEGAEENDEEEIEVDFEHSETPQPKERELFCKTCNKLFDNLHRLQRHMLSHDSNPDLRKFKCDFCDKAFKFKHHLKVRKKLILHFFVKRKFHLDAII